MSGSLTALDVFKSAAIQSEFTKNYSTLSQLLDYNLSGTVEFLKANGALSLGVIQHAFDVGYEGCEDGAKVWSEYEKHINGYVASLIANVAPKFQEQLNEARKQLSHYIHEEYFKKLPYWPNVGGKNMEDIELNISASYKSGVYHVVWSCIGLITVTDTRPNHDTFKAQFTGKPDVKVLFLDYSKVQELENVLQQRSIEECKQLIDTTKRSKGGNVLTWDAFK